MLYLHGQANPCGQILEILPHQPGPMTVTAPAITPQNQPVGPEIVPADLPFPPQGNTLTGKFGRVFTGAKRDIAGITRFIVQTMRHDHPIGIAGKTMIIDNMIVPLLHIHLTGAVDQAEVLFFFVSMLKIGFRPSTSCSPFTTSMYSNCALRSGSRLKVFFFAA